MDFYQQIQEKLSEIEQRYHVRILLACETGSRGWGFPSPDSDYDVRFIYVHQPDWYLSVTEKENHINVPINDELDITGWELRKSLQLLLKHNAALMERLQSPIIYRELDGFRETYLELANENFSPVSVMHHYLSIGKSYYEKCTGEEVKLKSLFYCIRSTMSAHWILEYQTMPHMELEKLMPVIAKNESLVKRIRELVELKAGKGEAYMHHAEPLVMDYLEQTIKTCDAGSMSLRGKKYEVEKMDLLLHQYVKTL